MRAWRALWLGGWGVCLLSSSAAVAMAGSEEDWSKALAKPIAKEARPLMESILNRTEDSDYSARAGIWLGQLEYTTGRVEAALPFFRQAESLAGDVALRAEAAFWAEHCGNLLAESVPGPEETTGSLPGSVTSSSDFFRTLAIGDAEIRAGRPVEALRRYLSLEGESRQLGLVGPLAYRVALVVAFARSAGETDPLFAWTTLDSWEPDLARSPERGLITALRRRDETLPAPPKNRDTRAATDFAELPGPAPKTQRVQNRSFPAPDFSPPDSLANDYRGGWLNSDRNKQSRAEARSRDEQNRPRVEERTTPRDTRYVIQLGAFSDRNTARREMERLTTRGLSVRLEPGWARDGGRVYRIQLGQPSSREEQLAFARRRLSGLDYQLVPIEP